MGDDVSLMDLFREEARAHAATLAQGLVALEQDASGARIEPLMRAAHSIKGAARIVQVEPAVRLAHVLEDALVAAQEGRARLGPPEIDAMLRAADVLATLASLADADKDRWGQQHQAELPALAEALEGIARGTPVAGHAPGVPAEGQEGTPEAYSAGTALVPADDPMWDLFRQEVRQAARALQGGLGGPVDEPMTQAARSIRAAAAIMHIEPAAALAGAMEPVLHAAQQAHAPLAEGERAALAEALAMLGGLLDLQPDDLAGWAEAQGGTLEQVRLRLGRPSVLAAAEAAERMPVGQPEPPTVPVEPKRAEPAEAVVRVTAESLSRLMSLAGESLVQARWLQPFSTALLKLKAQQDHLAALLDAAAQAGPGQPPLLEEARRQMAACRTLLAQNTSDFEGHAAQAEDLNSRLYREVIASRMRPFSDGAHGFPRLVRDMARSLGKQARLVIDGMGTEVDRDILERLEAPLNHMLRNALDHGIEPPADRRAAGKPEAGTLRLDVRHRAGMLAIAVGDDGAGIDIEALRRKVVEKGLARAELAGTMSEGELLEFLFLPGFSTAAEVTEYSGRGVGLDVVQDTIRKIGGSARVSTRPGQGTTFHLQLPLTLSVLRAVLADIAGEPYAFPHNRIDRLLMVPRAGVRSVEHRQFVNVDGGNVGLVLAAQLLALPAAAETDPLPVILLSDDTGSYGLIVEAFRGEQDLVVRPLDARLGKVPNVSAAAILDDGQPVLIADVEDMIRSMDLFIQAGTLARREERPEPARLPRRILVVDDSITVREAERQILHAAGYEVAVGVDGADGWNQVRASKFDLVVTDVDMPRMTGLELLAAIRSHPGLERLPVVIVSYKDRPEDRRKGLELGADRYLTKSSFHDDTFVQAVADLVGEA